MIKNVSLEIGVITPRSLVSRERITALFSVWRNLPEEFTPSHYGFHEPIKTPFSLEDAEEVLPGALNLGHGNITMFKRNTRISSLAFLSARRGWNSRCNSFMVRLDYQHLAGRLDVIRSYVRMLFEALDGAYAFATLAGSKPFRDDEAGEVGGVLIPPVNFGDGLKYLTAIHWINVFGREYVDFFGKDVLGSLGAVPSNDGKSYWLQPADDPRDMFTESGIAYSQELKRRTLKPRAFWDREFERRYDDEKLRLELANKLFVTPLYTDYETPVFDFSEIVLPRPNARPLDSDA
jgi:hypothetical protein